MLMAVAVGSTLCEQNRSSAPCDQPRCEVRKLGIMLGRMVDVISGRAISPSSALVDLRFDVICFRPSKPEHFYEVRVMTFEFSAMLLKRWNDDVKFIGN